jgi:hypothetical protein
MRRRHTRIAAAATALLAATVAAYALRPPAKTAVTLAARKPTVEIRTIVIRRTIHIVKHERAPVATGPAGHGGSFHGGGTAPRTHTSGSHAAASPAGAAVSTRVSGSHSVGASSGAPVTTRTSGSHGGSSGQPVTTRTSGSHGGDGEGADGSRGGDN